MKKRSSGRPACSRCPRPSLSYHCYCRACKNEHQRKHRRTYSELTPEQRRRANARCYANQYVRYGILKPKPCESCGDPKAQKHHDDYSKPLEVRWLCVDCHRRLHRKVG